MEPKSPAPELINERRDYFRIDDRALLRYQVIDEHSALNHRVPPRFSADIGYSLLRELQQIDQEHNKYLRPISEVSRELELYLRALSKKIEVIATQLAENVDNPPDLEMQGISISEGGMSLRTHNKVAQDNYLAIQLKLIPSFVSLVLFAKVVTSAFIGDEFTVAVSFVNLKDSDRQIIAKHIMQLQLAERRQQGYGHA